jgi:hypothetical protein
MFGRSVEEDRGACALIESFGHCGRAERRNPRAAIVPKVMVTT